MKVGIIGGGPAGMTAAIILSRAKVNVTIFDHMPRLGKKLLLTGSGKCNISNLKMDTSHYHGSGICFIDDLFSNCPSSNVYDFFDSIGIVTKEKNGYLYPYSENASSVLDCFRFAIRDLNIKLVNDVNICDIIPEKKGFRVILENDEYHYDRIIIATGGKSYKNTGSDGSGYELCQKLSHTIVKPLPALCSLNCKEKFYSQIAGIRTRANVSLMHQAKSIYSETGELQINKTGISGIPVFNLSYKAAQLLENKQDISVKIDFLPDISRDKFTEIINMRIKNFGNRPLEELYTGILNKNLGNLLVKLCNLNLSAFVSSLDQKDIKRLVETTKSFNTVIISTASFDNCQVTCGGVDCSEIYSTMESKLHKGLYFAGEVMDVNGDCGGYNLHFAFISAIVAAGNIIK